MVIALSRKLVLGSATLFTGFAAAHLIDEFLWDAPAEFHLSTEFTLLLALAFMTSLAGLLASAAAGSGVAFGGLALIGLLIALADTLKHVVEIIQDGPWRYGTVSEFLALGLTLSALLTAVTAGGVWWSGHGGRASA
jgi:hypothetical protein